LEINAAFAPEAWGISAICPYHFYSRGFASFAGQFFSASCGSAQCRRIVEIIKDALCGSGLNF
jgi:hypothetical protein